MKRFWKTTFALFKKDLKDATRNVSMGAMLLLAPIFAAILRFMSNIDMGSEHILWISVAMAMSMIPLSYLATIIAEEKEKNTLRTLMLSGVSSAEFLTSKILVVWILAEIVNVANFFICGYDVSGLLMYILITTVGSISLLMIGAVIGLISRDQMSTGVMSVPVIMLLLLPTSMKEMSPIFENLARFSPIEHTMQIFQIWQTGGNIFSKEGLTAFGVIAIWTVIAIVLYLVAYKKRRLDG